MPSPDENSFSYYYPLFFFISVPLLSFLCTCCVVANAKHIVLAIISVEETLDRLRASRVGVTPVRRVLSLEDEAPNGNHVINV